MDVHNTHLRVRIITEKNLRIGILLAFIRIVRTTIDLSTITCIDLKMIRNGDSVVEKLCTDILIKHLEVYPLLQWLVRCSIENVIYNLIKQRPLIDISVSDNLLH